MIDNIDFGFVLVVGIVAIFFGGCIWSLLNSAGRDHDHAPR